MMGKNPRETRRLMERMGMRVEEIGEVTEVILKTSTKNIIITRPSVTLTHIQGQTIYQIMGGTISEATGGVSKETIIPEEDIQLVAQQANVSIESAKKALEESKGNLAQAIILLAQRKG